MRSEEVCTLHYRGLLIASMSRSLTIYSIEALLILPNKPSISSEVRCLRGGLYLKIYKLNVRLAFVIGLLQEELRLIN